MKQHQENELLEWIKTLGLAAVLAIGIRTFIVEPRYIPSTSMVPTLEVNDRLLVEKITFRFREPKRGDIVVFSPTEKLREEGHTDDFIKRIIGLPKDKIEVKNGKVYVNDRPLAEKYILSPPGYRYGPVIVPDDEYLVLGDNRNNSSDSHVWGFVPRDNFIGRASVRFYPFDRIGSLYEEPIYPAKK
ncbi:MAG: signal peptidase I [Prochloraceae cyanobacterium]|nr:signal peptidase I [Prochloraceae cyanobacterium]